MAKSAYGQACSTQAKRKSMMAAIKVMAEEVGAKVVAERYVDHFGKPTEASITLTMGNYRVMMDFDGKNDCRAWLGHWYTESHSDAKYPKDFGYVIGGTVNEYHFGKATTCTETTFEIFKERLRSGFLVLKTLVSAITPERIIELVAKTAPDENGHGNREATDASLQLASVMRDGGVKLLQELVWLRRVAGDLEASLLDLDWQGHTPATWSKAKDRMKTFKEGFKG